MQQVILFKNHFSTTYHIAFRINYNQSLLVYAPILKLDKGFVHHCVVLNLFVEN